MSAPAGQVGRSVESGVGEGAFHFAKAIMVSWEDEGEGVVITRVCACGSDISSASMVVHQVVTAGLSRGKQRREMESIVKAER